jgi:cobalt/nickel transport system permease protein
MFERILTSVTKLIKSSLALEACAKKDGLLQRLDPRFVFLSMMLLVVITVLLMDMGSIVFMIALSIVLVLSSKVPIGWYLKRVWCFVPLFTLVIILPAMTNLITPGDSVLELIDVGTLHVYFTEAGVLNGTIFILRVGAAVSFCILMASTVEWAKLIRAMWDLRFPRTFVLILDMTYRYIHMMLDAVLSMFMARKSRMTGRSSSKEVRLIGGSTVTSLFSKTFHMSEQVYMAMLSRGYTGKPLMLTEFRPRAADYVFFVCMVAVGSLVLLYDNGWIDVPDLAATFGALII